MVVEYLKNDFQNDLHKMNLKQIECIKTCGPKNCKYHFDYDTLYFGPNDWEYNIKNIDENNYKYLFTCLFVITIIDMGIYKYCKNYYNEFRKKTMYPKFGNTGFGFSFISPKEILSIPEKNNLIKIEDASQIMNEIVEIFIFECNKYFENNIFSISTKMFIVNIINDKDMQPDGTSLIFELFIKILKEKILP
jgi:hypothetical protein